MADELKLEMRFHQSNREYEIIDWIHEARETAGGIVINPAAFTHTSVAILDALNTFEPPVIEVHISNVHKRESFRHHSYVSLRADGVIAGFGTQGYPLALRRLARLIDKKAERTADERPVRLAVLGAGLIGSAYRACRGKPSRAPAVVDPSPAGEAGRRDGARWFRVRALIAEDSRMS